MSTRKEIERPGLFMALAPIVITLFLLILQMFYFDDFTPHTPLILGLAITAAFAWVRGYRWSDIQDGAFHVVRVAIPAIAILMIIGMIIAIWIASGTVPFMMYYGFQVLSVEFFLPAAMILCSVVSLCLGTSWTTVGTVGLALMGIGSGFGIPEYWTAGAVVSGSFFGDKMSPLSDTTNLAPAVTGDDLFDHIRNMIPTTIPAMLIAFAVYVFVGFNVIDVSAGDLSKIEELTRGLESNFNLSIALLIPVILVIGMALKKMPAIPTLFVGVLASMVLTIVLQGATYHEALTYLQNGYKIDSGVAIVDSLLNRGGIQSMTWMITLVMIALAFGGALERTRCLETIVIAMLNKTRSFFGLQASATVTSIGTNVIAGDPYLSIALPARMYAQAYRGRDYSTLNLSRAVEEGGTLVSPLIPWNAGGAFVITALGLGIADGNTENLLYIVCAIACWLSPVLGLTYAAFGVFSPRASDEEKKRWEENNEPILVTPIEDEVQDSLVKVM